MTTQTDDYEERIRNLETTVTRHDAILPTLAYQGRLGKAPGRVQGRQRAPPG